MSKPIIVTSILTLTLSLAFTGAAQAAPQTTIPAKVNQISAFNASSGWNDNVELTGITHLGNCATDTTTGLVIFRYTKNTDGTNPSNDRVFTLLLTAYTLGKNVVISTDDTTGLLNGACAITWVNLNP